VRSTLRILTKPETGRQQLSLLWKACSKTYQAILKQKPEAKAKPLDALLKKQSQGKLDEALKQCP
jgi:hypothetical protein